MSCASGETKARDSGGRFVNSTPEKGQKRRVTDEVLFPGVGQRQPRDHKILSQLMHKGKTEKRLKRAEDAEKASREAEVMEAQSSTTARQIGIAYSEHVSIVHQCHGEAAQSQPASSEGCKHGSSIALFGKTRSMDG